MGRPKSTTKKTETIQVRMEESEHALFSALVAARAAELKAEGVEVTGPSVIRWLINREIAARGIAAQPLATTPKATKKGATPARKPAK